eukprot:14011591-Alexandrium_andersonii.AAC.1
MPTLVQSMPLYARRTRQHTRALLRCSPRTFSSFLLDGSEGALLRPSWCPHGGSATASQVCLCFLPQLSQPAGSFSLLRGISPVASRVSSGDSLGASRVISCGFLGALPALAGATGQLWGTWSYPTSGPTSRPPAKRFRPHLRVSEVLTTAKRPWWQPRRPDEPPAKLIDWSAAGQQPGICERERERARE